MLLTDVDQMPLMPPAPRTAQNVARAAAPPLLRGAWGSPRMASSFVHRPMVWLFGAYGVALGVSLCYKIAADALWGSESTADADADFAALLNGALLGAVSAAVVVGYYLATPKLRTHTNRLLFWRSLCDLGMGILILSYCFASLAFGGPGTRDSDGE